MTTPQRPDDRRLETGPDDDGAVTGPSDAETDPGRGQRRGGPVHDADRIVAVLEEEAGDLLDAMAQRRWLADTTPSPADLLDTAVLDRELRYGRERDGIDRGLTVHHVPVGGGSLTHVQFTRVLGHDEGATGAATRLSVNAVPDLGRAYAVRSLRRRADPRDVDRLQTYTVLDPDLGGRGLPSSGPDRAVVPRGEPGPSRAPDRSRWPGSESGPDPEAGGVDLAGCGPDPTDEIPDPAGREFSTDLDGLDPGGTDDPPRVLRTGDLAVRLSGSVAVGRLRTCDAYGDDGICYRRFPPGGWWEKYDR